MFIRPDRLDPDRAALVVIDVQDKLLPAIHEAERVMESVRQLVLGARLFGLPILVTEQHPRGLGRTHGRIVEALDPKTPILEKPSFSACGTEAFREALRSTGRSQVVLAGIEAHVCIQQSALDLACMDYDVFVCADATGSRGVLSYETALHRMRQRQVIVTTVESALFEWCERCDAARFKAMLELIKAFSPR